MRRCFWERGGVGGGTEVLPCSSAEKKKKRENKRVGGLPAADRCRCGERGEPRCVPAVRPAAGVRLRPPPPGPLGSDPPLTHVLKAKRRPWLSLPRAASMSGGNGSGGLRFSCGHCNPSRGLLCTSASLLGSGLPLAGRSPLLSLIRDQGRPQEILWGLPPRKRWLPPERRCLLVHLA